MKRTTCIAACALLFGSIPISAQVSTEVFLVAKPFTKTLPDGNEVPMWGYALDADNDLTTDGGEPAGSPGPRIVVDPTASLLRIHLRNDLPVDTSIVIPGQSTTLAPVSFTDAQGRERVSSFAAGVAPGSIGTYEWVDVRAGAFLYQSGTHAAVQVQMGLVGALTKDTAAGQAYPPPAPSHQAELVLVYSEIDPDLHAAVAAGTYGTAAYPSAIHYRPRYFLVNGEPYSPASQPLPLAPPRQATLLRLLNAGYEAHTPLLLGLEANLLAEDGYPLAARRRTSSFYLPAGKTADALVQPTRAGVYPLFDRSMALSTAGSPDGGMLVHLSVPAALTSSKLSAR